MQRDSIVWQDEPNSFVPERWVGLAEGHDDGYMLQLSCKEVQERAYAVRSVYGRSTRARACRGYSLQLGDQWRLSG
jgi:hypothetical protein